MASNLFLSKIHSEYLAVLLNDLKSAKIKESVLKILATRLIWFVVKKSTLSAELCRIKSYKYQEFQEKIKR